MSSACLFQQIAWASRQAFHKASGHSFSILKRTQTPSTHSSTRRIRSRTLDVALTTRSHLHPCLSACPDAGRGSQRAGASGGRVRQGAAIAKATGRQRQHTPLSEVESKLLISVSIYLSIYLHVYIYMYKYTMHIDTYIYRQSSAMCCTP